MSTGRPSYGYPELADRIEAVLGERPSRSSLRAARAEARRWGTRRQRPSKTAGMPAPLPAASRTAPARFDAQQVETWLANHPALAWDKTVARTRERLAAGEQIEDVLADALRDGLSWAVLTELVNEADQARGRRARTKSAIYDRYRHLDPTRRSGAHGSQQAASAS